jgi:rfaE bifunctional protein kinase chain/domain
MDNGRFQELLEQYTTRRIAVVGDFILDEYTIGDTKRVSREAPVIVVDYRESRFHPGGAANAVQNVASLGGIVSACGVIGDDREGNILSDVLGDRGVDVSTLFRHAEVSTAMKTRIMAGELNAQKQQIARVDRSRPIASDSPLLKKFVDDIAPILGKADAVLMSDYGLGVTSQPLCAKIIERCRDRNIPVVVDSRFRLMDFAGATVAVPNEVELVDSVPPWGSDSEVVAARAVAELGLGGLIVTRGSQGMMVVTGSGSRQVGIVGSRDVADVTGAGDTVAASVALCLACGATLAEAAEMATYAAAVVVMKRGTATVNRTELENMRAKYPRPAVVEDTV